MAEEAGGRAVAGSHRVFSPGRAFVGVFLDGMRATACRTDRLILWAAAARLGVTEV